MGVATDGLDSEALTFLGCCGKEANDDNLSQGFAGQPLTGGRPTDEGILWLREAA